jgi:hypothetical protein
LKPLHAVKEALRPKDKVAMSPDELLRLIKDLKLRTSYSTLEGAG